MNKENGGKSMNNSGKSMNNSRKSMNKKVLFLILNHYF